MRNYELSKRKSGKEQFSNGKKLIDFWQWAHSDILGNAERGKLAEFIVAMALDIDKGCRTEWDAYDLLTVDNIKIEVKSSAYLQTWKQKNLSRIVFDIRPTRIWDENTHNYSDDRLRRSDIYVFCIFKCTDIKQADLLNFDQWEFLVVKTSELNDKLKKQKSISLNSIKKLQHKVATFEMLKDVIENL